MASRTTPPLNKELRAFDRSLPMRLLKAREVVMRKFQPSLRAHDLTAQQWRVLRALVENNGIDASEIAERCAILMPSLSRILQNLQGRGLIVRETCDRDQRRSLVSITPRGRGLVRKIAPLSEERYDYITERFGEKNMTRLYELLGELIECMEEDEP
ncbi:MAG: homoprotocatechuate degradation operon regulator HpaR [Haliea sp.]|nr:homoprotocatechuate degradation operon regulator HpaR [Haliea sp.]